MPVDFGAVVAAVGIAGNAVPVEGRGVAEAANGHGRAGLDLVATADDGRFENPEELVGVSVGMAAGAGEGCGRGGLRGVEGNASSFELGRCGIVERNGCFENRLGGIGNIDERDGI